MFVERSLAALTQHKNTLGIASTGFGKSFAIAAVADNYAKNGARVGVLAHRDELVFQNEEKYRRFSQRDNTAIINAGNKKWDGQVSFAMIQTASRSANLESMPPLDLLVIDEAHHAPSSTYRRLISHAKDLNNDLDVYGVTATPERSDGRGLNQVFSNVADQVRIGEIIKDGHLVPPRTFVIDVGTQQQLSNVSKSVDDFDMSAVAQIMDKQNINDAVVRQWKKMAADRKTIVFCSTVDHARNVCKSFTDAGVNAAVVHGGLTSTKRKQLLEQFEHNDLQVLLNCFVLTEGFDSQPVSCVILLRPSSHKSTYIQMIGRGLRTVDPNIHPGVIKKDCIVLDFGISTLDHGSLEQDARINVDSRSASGSAPQKECFECNCMIPIGSKTCPLCGFIFNYDDESQFEDGAKNEELDIDDFLMTEVDIFKRSPFRWCDLFADEASYLATGFEAWAGVFFKDGIWYGVGGRKKQKTKLLAIAERKVCFAAADDWLNTYETDSGAKKSRSWLNQPITSQQLKFLPAHFKHDFNLNRYHASCLLAFRFNKRDIHSCINQYHREAA